MRGLPEPFRSRHLLQTSRYLRNTGQPDTALRWLAALSTGNRPSRGRLLEETVCLEQLHKYDEALGTLALLLEDHPDDIEALEMQAMLLTLSGHTLRARKAFLHMLSAPDVRPETRLKYAIALQYMGDPAGSRSELISLCRDEPDNAEAWYRLGLLHARNRQVMAAQHALNRALEAAPWREDIQGALKQLADGEPSRR
jgi:predicted Zn-dependent protease